MLRRGMTIGGGLALTLTGLLLCAGPAAAQRYNRGGWAPARGWNYGSTNGYTPFGSGYQNGWYGYNTYNYAAPQNFTYGAYYHPYSGNYWDYSYNNAYPQYSSGYFNPSMYTGATYNGLAAPAYGGQYVTSGTNPGYEGAYESSDESMNNPNAISVNVRVPADAKVWFDKQATQQQGTFRQFISPPVQPGKAYTYTIKAEWMDNGKKVEKTKEVDVHAGDHFTLDMRQGKNGTVSFNNGANGTNRTGTGVDTFNDRDRNNNNRYDRGTNRTTVPNDIVPPSGNRTNPNDLSNAPGAGGATPNINRTNPPNNTNKNPTTGDTGTNPTGLNPTTTTPTTTPTSPSSNRSTVPGTGSKTPQDTNSPSTSGTGTPAPSKPSTTTPPPGK